MSQGTENIFSVPCDPSIGTILMAMRAIGVESGGRLVMDPIWADDSVVQAIVTRLGLSVGVVSVRGDTWYVEGTDGRRAGSVA